MYFYHSTISFSSIITDILDKLISTQSLEIKNQFSVGQPCVLCVMGMKKDGVAQYGTWTTNRKKTSNIDCKCCVAPQTSEPAVFINTYIHTYFKQTERNSKTNISNRMNEVNFIFYFILFLCLFRYILSVYAINKKRSERERKSCKIKIIVSAI